MLVDSPFRPAWWLPGPHAQTLWAGLGRRMPRFDLDWERVDLPDGDFVELATIAGRSLPESAPTALLLHGLTGSVDSPHLAGLLAELDRRGWRAIAFHFRGCGPTPNTSTIGYHSGKTDDPRHVLERLRERHRGPLAVVGFSLGANVVLKMLGEGEATGLVDVAAAVSPPLVISRCADRMERGLSSLYQRTLLKGLDQYMRRRAAAGAPLDLSVLDGIRTFRDFDDRVTAPAHGFADSADYYARVSSRQFLPRITTRTLVIHAVDDPFFTPDVVPSPDEIPDCVTFELAPRGGHVGFVEGSVPFRGRYHLDDRIPAFLEGVVHGPGPGAQV